MPRKFGLRSHARRFWNEQPGAIREEHWAWWLIGGSVLVIAAVGILIA